MVVKATCLFVPHEWEIETTCSGPSCSGGWGLEIKAVMNVWKRHICFCSRCSAISWWHQLPREQFFHHRTSDTPSATPVSSCPHHTSAVQSQLFTAHLPACCGFAWAGQHSACFQNYLRSKCARSVAYIEISSIQYGVKDPVQCERALLC